MEKEKSIRIDQYLWAIRIFKTRTQATNAIHDGKVKFKGESFKPSKAVMIGETYSIKTSEKRITIQVSNIINKRVQYSDAILNYFDVSTEEDRQFNSNKLTSSFYTGKRQSNTGRPTKKQSRDLNEFKDGFDASNE